MYQTTDIFLGSAELFVDGQNVGWTKGGLRMRTNKNMWYRPSYNGLGVEEAVKKTEEFYISTVLVEGTLDNLKRVWSINEPILSPDGAGALRRIDFGGASIVPVHSLLFITKKRVMKVGFYRAVAMDFGEIIHSKSQENMMPVTFRVLLDTSRVIGSQIGFITEGPYFYMDNLIVRVTVGGPFNGTSNLICKTKVY